MVSTHAKTAATSAQDLLEGLARNRIGDHATGHQFETAISPKYRLSRVTTTALWPKPPSP